MHSMCFLGGVGFQELLLLLVFLFFFLSILAVFVIVVIKLSRRKAINGSDSQTLILQNAEKLKELKLLQDKGIISSAEFESEKRKIIGV